MTPTNTAPGHPSDHLSAAELARAEALTIARQTVRTGGGPFNSGSISIEIPELIDIAEYVINGTHPLARYGPAVADSVTNLKASPKADLHEAMGQASETWEQFSEAVDELGWTNTKDPETFNYAVHKVMQALRDYLREGES